MRRSPRQVVGRVPTRKRQRSPQLNAAKQPVSLERRHPSEESTAGEHSTGPAVSIGDGTPGEFALRVRSVSTLSEIIKERGI